MRLIWLRNTGKSLSDAQPHLAAKGLCGGRGRVCWHWEFEIGRFRQITARPRDNDPPPILRNAKVGDIEELFFDAIATSSKVLLNFLDCATSSQAKNPSDILCEKIERTLIFNYSFELQVQPVPLVLLKTEKVRLRESLTRKTAHNRIAIWYRRRGNVFYRAPDDVMPNVPAICRDGIRIDVIGPNNIVP